MFHLRQLQCALALAECGSFQLASQRLGITPSGLTQSIQRLESHYGSALFSRSRSGVSLTPKGAIVVEGAREIVQRALTIEREIELATNPEKGLLNIGVDPTLVNTLLAPALVHLMQVRPGIRYTVVNSHRPVLCKLLETKQIDFFLSYPSLADQAGGLKSIELAISAPIVVGRPGHPLSRKARRKIQEYFEYPRLGARTPEWYFEWARQELRRDGLEVDPTADYQLYADDLGLMKAIVQQTDSLLGLYREDARLELDAGLLIEMNPINWPQQVPIELVTTAGRPLAVTTEKLVEAIIQALP